MDQKAGITLPTDERSMILCTKNCAWDDSVTVLFRDFLKLRTAGANAHWIDSKTNEIICDTGEYKTRVGN